MDARVATTVDLMKIMRDGVEFNLTHQLPLALVANLDGHGHHVLIMERWGGRGIDHIEYPLHHTLSGILELDHDPRPFCVRVDVTDARWVKLEPWEVWHKRVQAEQKEREEKASV